jgi:putative protease
LKEIQEKDMDSNIISSINNNIELLAPAGNWDAFVAAVENGADAVYLGGKLFNARHQAGNFDEEQLKKALDYAHNRDTKIYLTMNTIISQDEMEEALDFAQECYLMGIDGIIVQDIGFARLTRKILPKLSLHASTQMTIYNLEAVKILEQLGFKRVVLARELSLEEISYISKNTNLEIEVFIHGALCISYSGQCLMSSMIGGRSGNRGKCAQPCRLPYSIYSNKMSASLNYHKDYDENCKYLLSPKDLSTIHILDSIIKSGVKSLKIEGRMKTPEYVATVVGIYRKYLDRILEDGHKEKQENYIAEDRDVKDLTQIFNRGGFSEGYLGGKIGRDMISHEKPKNWGIFIGKIISYNNKNRTIKLRLEDSLSTGDGIEVWNGENKSPGTIISNIIKDGKGVDTASKGDVITAGDIRGNIFKGNPVYRTSEKKLNMAARESFTGKPKRKVLLKGQMVINNEKPLLLTVSDKNGNVVCSQSQFIPETAVSTALSEDRVKAQLNRTGDTPFEFEELIVNIAPGLSVPVREINSIRRSALADMERIRVSSYYRDDKDINYRARESFRNRVSDMKKTLPYYSTSFDRVNSSSLKLSLYLYESKIILDNANEISDLSVNRIYIPFKTFFHKNMTSFIDGLHLKKIEAFAWIPTITKGNYNTMIKTTLGKVVEVGIDGLLIGNLGSFEYAREYPDLKLVGDFQFNIFNGFTLEQLKKLGLCGLTLSPEMTMSQIELIEKDVEIDIETLVYGRLPLMISEYCAPGSILGDSTEKLRCCDAPCKTQTAMLKDRMGMEFPILCDDIDCRSIILNSNVLFMPESIDRLGASGVNTARICIYDENIDEINEIVLMHKDIIKNGLEVTNKYKNLIHRIKSRGFTKGHYYRGV